MAGDALPFSIWHLDPSVSPSLVGVDGFSSLASFSYPSACHDRGVPVRSNLHIADLVRLPLRMFDPRQDIVLVCMELSASVVT